jgi:hypothetical protein
VNTQFMDSLVEAFSPAMTPEEKDARKSALASNVLAEAMALEGRVIMTDDDARRRDIIRKLLDVEATAIAGDNVKHSPLKADVQTPTNPKLEQAAAILHRVGHNAGWPTAAEQEVKILGGATPSGATPSSVTPSSEAARLWGRPKPPNPDEDDEDEEAYRGPIKV